MTKLTLEAFKAMSPEAQAAAIAAFNEASSRPAGKLTVKVNAKTAEKPDAKGTVCVYGLGRHPVALYASQWKRLAAFLPEVVKYIESNPAGMATEKQ